MSAMLTVEDAIARVPGWDPSDVDIIERLDGLTNRSYGVRLDSRSYVLRVDAAHTAAFALDRQREHDIMRAAAAKGLAPEVVFAEQGILVTEYIDGPVWSADEVSETKRLEQLAGLLRRVHELPLSGHRMDAAQVAATYLEAIPGHGKHRSLAEQCVASIEQWGSDGEARLCHNDVIAANIIGDESPMMLDWEYACDNDALFDLACLIEYHHLDDDSADVLLSAYTGSAEPSSRERLADQRRRYDALQFLWFAAREAASVSDPG